jgi:PhoP regulatory network protein YrbL
MILEDEDQLNLKGTPPLLTGQARHVFVHPRDRRLLIKIPRIDQPPKFHRYRRYGVYLTFLRELREQLALAAADQDFARYSQEIVGIAKTDIGLGLVVKAELDENGELAPTLRILLKEGRFTPEILENWNEFEQTILASPMILGDFHSGNVVYSHSKRHGNRFVIIDGYGFKTAFPIERFSKLANALRKKKLFARTRVRFPKS